ncbi:MAG: hypothetical protein H7062_13260 [Candidatus Saccharimonas sp.]|nr:hypothetical protein [Planctomycetaceae bacterium]
MNRWSLGIAAAVGLIAGPVDVARAQSFYVYEAPTVYSAPVYSVPVYAAPAFASGGVYQSQVIVPARSVVSAGYVAPYAYSAPVVIQQPIAQMAFSSPAYVPVQAVVAAPVVVSRPTTIRETTRVSRHNYTHTVRVDGPTDGPRYSRVHVHSGLFGTTVRERVR